MKNTDYNKIMKEIISKFDKKPRLLLHSCCAPCSSSVLTRLLQFFDITIFFYNPNMDTLEEFTKRQSEEIRLVEELNKEFDSNIDIVKCQYDKNEYLTQVKGLEDNKEGGKRCEKCFRLRLEKTCQYAKKHQFDYFTTTLSVSPYKNSKLLNEIGEELEKKYGVNYLYSDFKKEEGYRKSIELSKRYNLYRQNYCGCEFSKKARELFEKNALTEV